jgi:hypothetical protein
MSNKSKESNKNSVLSNPIFQKIKLGALYIWHRPLILTLVFAVIAVAVSNLIVKQSFKSQFNCDYIFAQELKIPESVCHGFTLGQIPGVSDATSLLNSIGSSLGLGNNTIPSDTQVIPDLSGVVDPALEKVRRGITWLSVLFLGFISIYLTIIFNNMKLIAKLASFNREEWARFLGSIRTWLVIFTFCCLLFYIFTPK